MPVMVTPAALAITSAFDRAFSTARARASFCVGSGSCRPKVMPPTLVAPALMAASIIVPVAATDFILAVTVLLHRYPVRTWVPPGLSPSP